MAIFLGAGFCMTVLAWIGYDLCRYGYEQKIKPHVPDLIYYLEAHWELHKIRVGAKVKELKERDYIPYVEIEPIEDLEKWDNVVNGQRIPPTTKLIEND